MDITRWTPRQYKSAERLVVDAAQFLGDVRAAVRQLRRLIDEADQAAAELADAQQTFDAQLAAVTETRDLLLRDENALVERIAARVTATLTTPTTP